MNFDGKYLCLQCKSIIDIKNGNMDMIRSSNCVQCEKCIYSLWFINNFGSFALRYKYKYTKPLTPIISHCINITTNKSWEILFK